ncbi:class I SAM-dependent methyltransferase [Methylophilus medardicus]|uniref:Class I SAM-dependent methyltransferase n=1 Tax=Methylophilus medardicus TaxID=2588534 RepID=A0A5B8CT01_9PROT|nr:class I SAM-dependent methyltransferase [Methylophilus medardicus]QDC44349.1 class I SAM-dependent methyltransferase [Methylophilus medardicus]QDC49356.1 class I SAM-dependent methyltransferase [Methylophilus medardicus]QDC53061.1 class I SAM-dependent methyltransferase [Methylophilus medardicus]
MSNLWQQIWEKRSLQPQHRLTLDTLIALDGFDSGAGKINLADWQEYTRRISEKLQLQSGHSVFEVGCGAGAFLFALREQHTLTVGGLDYAAGLIEAAKQAMPDGDFKAQSAQTMDTEPQYDFVIANSVFHYFDEAMAAAVLQAMWKKARLGVAILDVPHAATKAACERARRDALSEAEYEEKYRGLHHTYFSPDWFSQQLPDTPLQTFESCVPHYAQSQYRFSVIFSKRLHG